MKNGERALLDGLELFSSLDEAGRDAVMAEGQCRRLPAGAVVFSQGQEAKEFYVLAKGRLQVQQTTRDGQEVFVRHIAPGEVFGIARALRRSDYPATATAVTDSIAFVWPNERWEGFVATIPSFAGGLIGALGRRMQESDARVRELATEEVERRVARALLRLIAQAPRAGTGEVAVDFPLRRKDLALMSGTTLHTVSRIISSWQDAGLVAAGRQRLTVRDVEGLRGLAEGE